jgi:glutathione S-transferase
MDDKSVLTENAAIQQYLADSKKADQLLPPVGNMQRYRVIEWLNFVATELHKGAGVFFHPAVTDAMKDEIFRPILVNKFKFVEEQLGKNAYISGDHFTLPDSYLFVILTWLPATKINIKDFPNTAKYFETLKQRASVMKSLKEEGLA